MRFLLPLLALIILPTQALGNLSLVVGSNEKVFGKPIEAYTSTWYQWRYSKLSRTTASCSLNQSGNVWFLREGEPLANPSKRSLSECAIPRNKYLFVPLLTKLTGGGTGRPCGPIIEKAKLNPKNLKKLEVKIDGVAIAQPELHQYTSPTCFDLNVKDPEIPKGYGYPSATSGFWMMLRPLPRGDHKVSIAVEHGGEEVSPYSGKYQASQSRRTDYLIKVIE